MKPPTDIGCLFICCLQELGEAESIELLEKLTKNKIKTYCRYLQLGDDGSCILHVDYASDDDDDKDELVQLLIAHAFGVSLVRSTRSILEGICEPSFASSSDRLHTGVSGAMHSMKMREVILALPPRDCCVLTQCARGFFMQDRIQQPLARMERHVEFAMSRLLYVDGPRALELQRHGIPRSAFMKALATACVCGSNCLMARSP